MSIPEVDVSADPQALAELSAARLITKLVAIQSTGVVPSVVLTGGGTGIGMLAAIAASPAHAGVDWSRVDFWWGDERFLPAGDPDRNETQAREALLDLVNVDPARIHAMPASDGPDGDDPEAAAARYTSELAASAQPEDHGPVPRFSVCLLGMGPDAHIASLFPEHPALLDNRPAVGVRGSPKPPPTRVSLTLPTIQAAEEVWLVVAGADKAPAVRLALSGAGERQAPAAAAIGRQRTLWLLDREAASELPPALDRLASP